MDRKLYSFSEGYETGVIYSFREIKDIRSEDSKTGYAFKILKVNTEHVYALNSVETAFSLEALQQLHDNLGELLKVITPKKSKKPRKTRTKIEDTNNDT